MKILENKELNESINLSREDLEEIRGLSYNIMELFMVAAGKGSSVEDLGKFIGESIKKSIQTETVWINGRERMPPTEALTLKKSFFQALSLGLR